MSERGLSERVRCRGTAEGSTMTGVSSVWSSSAPSRLFGSGSGVVFEVTRLLGSLEMGFFAALVGVEVGDCGWFEPEEEELAMLLALALGSTNDFDLSRPCFWKNLGNFELWWAEGGAEDEKELRGLLLDISSSAGFEARPSPRI
jgi:hypothetical protein